jgi:hypothetical protein
MLSVSLSSLLVPCSITIVFNILLVPFAARRYFDSAQRFKRPSVAQFAYCLPLAGLPSPAAFPPRLGTGPKPPLWSDTHPNS